MNQIVRSNIKNKRTNANISGIDIQDSDLQYRSADYRAAFNSLAKYAAEAEKLKVNNLTKGLMNDLKLADVEFTQKYLTSATVYSNDEENINMLKAYKELENHKKSLVGAVDFLDTQEKQNLIDNVHLDYKYGLVDHTKNRNEAYLKHTISETEYNITQTKEIVSQLHYDDYKGITSAISDIKDDYMSLYKLGVITSADVGFNSAKDIAEIDAQLINKQIHIDILDNSTLSFAQKEAKLKEAKAVLKSDDRIEEIINNYGFTDQKEREYFKAKLKKNYKSISGDFDTYLKRLRLNASTQSTIDREKIESTAYQNDGPGHIKALTHNKLDPSTEMMLSDKSLVGAVTNLTLQEFGDPSNPMVFSYLTTGVNRGLSNQVASNKANGLFFTEAYKPVYDAASTFANGDLSKRVAIIKDFALKNKIDPTVLLKGEYNPDYFKVNDILLDGRDIAAQSGLSFRDMLPTNWWGGNTRALDVFNTLSSKFSLDPAVGDKYATEYIFGMAKQLDQSADIMERPELVLTKLSTTSNFYINVDIAKELSLSRVPYKYVDMLRGKQNKF